MKKPHWITSKKFLIGAGIALAVLLAIFLITRWATPNDPNTDPSAPSTSQNTQHNPLIPDIMGTAKTIKSNLMAALEYLKQSNFPAARQKLLLVQQDIASVRKIADNFSLLIQLIPQADGLYKLLDAVDAAIPEILLPAIDLMERYPLSDLRVGDGYNVVTLYGYIDFAEEIMPKLESLLSVMNAADLSLLDSDGKIEAYLEPINKLMDGFRENPDMLPMIKQMLGSQGDRLYIIAVQNPSEIRASGGFPGFMGRVRIESGVLTIGEFESVKEFLATWVPQEIQITKEESALFSYLSTMSVPRDADLCPDYERVGHIWACAYEAKNNEPVDGVISITPHIVQRLLAASGQEIILFDGSVLTGDNAMKVLIHDIYFKYFDRRNPHPDKFTISDELFAEAAEKTMSTLTEDISVSRLLEFLPVLKESIADRTLMLWMADETEQAFVMDQGWSGGLNKDPENPEAGIYVNVVSASKMGWFLLMDTEIGERTQNADGSYTYPITVTINNNITQEEIKAADTYISGGLVGSMRTVVYFFAPAGGNVDNFSASTGQKISIKTYNGMTLGHMDSFLLKPDTPVTITYTVTTAPGVETPLALSKTPTAQ